MRTHPLWRPYDPAATLDRRRFRVACRQVHVSGVVPYDPSWPEQFERVRHLLTAVLGPRALEVHHVGSTSVPGLAAKPIIDVDVLVEDSTAEGSYLPSLEAAGFRLVAREPEWEEHRFFTTGHPNANVHVFSPDAIEPRRHRVFRDWLRSHGVDRERYGRIKQDLTVDGFGGKDYNGGKAGFVYDLYEDIFAADPDHPHDRRPRG